MSTVSRSLVASVLAGSILLPAGLGSAQERRALRTPEILLQAVAFALTGTDNANVQSIDRTNCVFRIKNQIFHLNNIHGDRLKIQSWIERSRLGDTHYVTVALHGDSTVYEEFADGVKESDLAPEVAREWKRADPSAFEGSHTTSNEIVLKLITDEKERVVRAWQFLYANGCVAKVSGF